MNVFQILDKTFFSKTFSKKKIRNEFNTIEVWVEHQDWDKQLIYTPIHEQLVAAFLFLGECEQRIESKKILFKYGWLRRNVWKIAMNLI